MRLYTITGTIASVSAARDLLRVKAAATLGLILVRASFMQDTSETSEQLPVSMYRASDDGTGTSVTVNPVNAGDAAATLTAVSDLSVATTKSPTQPLWSEAQNVLGGWLHQPSIEERPELAGGGRWAWRLETAPSAALAIRFHVTVLEVG